LECRTQALEHLRQSTRLLASTDEAHEHRTEHGGERCQPLRQHLAPFDVFEYRRQHFAEARILRSIAQIAQALNYGDSRARDLLQIEAEGDKVAASDAAASQSGMAAADEPESDEIKPHALQAQLEVDLVGGVKLSARSAAQLIDGLVLKRGHE